MIEVKTTELLHRRDHSGSEHINSFSIPVTTLLTHGLNLRQRDWELWLLDGRLMTLTPTLHSLRGINSLGIYPLRYL